MIIGLDSAFAPGPAAAQAARAAGVRLWNGYLATRPGVGLDHPWARMDFEAARICGGIPIAFCSGWDDPLACAILARQWQVRLCLDVEGEIRADGPWVQPWLDASGAGLYGVKAVHNGRRAAFHVLAWYLNADPAASWSGQRPPKPCGWQWHNSHNEFGVTVDRGWYDDYFAGGSPMLKIVNAQGGDHDYLTDGMQKRPLYDTAEEGTLRQLWPEIGPTQTIPLQHLRNIPTRLDGRTWP